MERDQEEGQQRPRPRVVDKRVSARTQGQEAAREPSPTAQQRAEPTEPEPATEAPGAEPAAEASGPGPVWTPEQEAEARKLLEQIARTPGRELVSSVVVNLTDFAGVKLEVGDLEGAQLAIDALDGVVNAVGGRLGEAEAPFRSVLAQLQMAYAQRAAAPPGAE